MRCLRADRLVVAVKPSQWGWSEGAGSLVNCSREQPGSFREETSGQVRFGRQAVWDTEAAGVGGVSESQGQQGCRRGGWAVQRRLRGGSEVQSVQDLESDVVGDLLSACGDGGGDTQDRQRWGPKNAGCAHRRRSGRTDSRFAGAAGSDGVGFSSRLLRVPAPA